MADEILKKRQLEGKPMERIRAFVEERFAGFQVEAPQDEVERVRSRDLAPSGDLPVETTLDVRRIAQYRLQKLQEFRRRQTEKESGGLRARAMVDLNKNNWIPLGPSVVRNGQAANHPRVSGRVRGIAVTPNGSRVYVASANGGVWRSLDKGDSWVSLMDRPDYSFDLDPSPTSTEAPTSNRADSLACGALALVAGATPEEDVIFVGTGEASGEFFGVGPIISDNGGRTWRKETVAGGNPASLFGHSFYAMEADPHSSRKSRVVAATTNGVYRREPSGDTHQWVRKALPGIAGNATPTDIVVSLSGNNTTFFAASDDGRIFSSPDGDTWTQLGAQIPLPGNLLHRLSLAVQPSNPNVVYAFRSDGAIFRYDDVAGDRIWKQIAILPSPDPIPNNIVTHQGDYDLSIAVSPTNVNTIVVGGSTIRSDTDGRISTDPNDTYAGAVYRMSVAVDTSATPRTASASFAFIGGSVHADIHAIVFPGFNGNELWIGCDGGVFFTPNVGGAGMIFKAKNNGLQTLTMNMLGQHPTSEAVVFCGTQDNGGLRFTGEEAWLHSTPGDAGYVVVNWKETHKILSTGYLDGTRYMEDGGNDKNTIDWRGPNVGNEFVLFYAPLAGTPAPADIPAAPAADANLVAFGAQTLWLSTDFGANWTSIPNADPNINSPQGGGNFGVGPIRSITFASPTKIYVGTLVGGASARNPAPPPDRIRRNFNLPAVYRYTKSGANWTVSANLLAGSPVPNATVTSIAIDPTDANGDSFYISVGGTGDYRHVWRCQFNPADGSTAWTAKSGPAANDPASLLDIHYNTVLALRNPTAGQGNLLYAGGDIGVWHAVDDGAQCAWQTYSEGLPDAAVMDLKHQPVGNLLRASTHGRGVFERKLPDADTDDVELYIRATQLDIGRETPVDNRPDPLDRNKTVSHKNSPDIKVDIPNNDGDYQFAEGNRVDFAEFVDELNDRSQETAYHNASIVSNKVYAQVHNRGPKTAERVRVMLLLAHVPADAPPALPANYLAAIQNGTPLNTNQWLTADMREVERVQMGLPQVAELNLSSDKFRQLLPAGSLNDKKFGLLVLLHQAEDPFDYTNGADDRSVAAIALNEKKAAYKEIKLKAFTGTLPIEKNALPLAGFVKIPASATAPGAPFDAFLGRAFRLNDDALARAYAAVSVSPLIANGADGVKNNAHPPDAKQLLSAISITLDQDIELEAGVPLVWMARQKITINKKINALGKGASRGEDGGFGGSGGGGSAAGEEGKASRIPVSGITILNGGPVQGAGNELTEAWASRAVLLPALSKGGASGGGANGGAGGGVVFLSAPVIEFGADGEIDARGAGGGANSGGGGGGLVILIAREFIGFDNGKVKIDGGAGTGGGAGGRGCLLKKEIGY